MQLTILGSNSSGNAYILQNNAEALIIECGVRFNEIKRALDFNITKICACIVSHEHKDHAGYMNEIINARIPVWCSRGTFENTVNKSKLQPNIAKSKQTFCAGNFKILPFDIRHDAAEPLGFFINHAECGNVLFATDTFYLRYKFSNLNNILIECNYSENLLYKNVEDGKLPYAMQQRVLQSHMSYETCCETLLANDLSKVNNIVLIHLSDGNSNAGDFQKGISEITGKNVFIAEKGMTINFDKTPF
jgi:phosphoribosyl 1,2-cyclic phosphodiesterase